MNQQDASRIKELGLNALKNPDPDARKEALLELRKYDTPIITEVLEQVIHKDRDKAVRDLAQNLLTKRQIQDSKRPSTTNIQSAARNASKASDMLWTCDFCGSETNDPQRCPNCGAERKPTSQGNMTKAAVNGEPFVLHPGHQNFVFGNSKRLNRNSFFGVGCLASFFGIFVIVGIMMLGLMLRDTYEWYIINRSGVGSTGQLVDRRISSDDDGDDYYVSFQYSHNGRNFKREQRVSWDIYNHAEVGGNISILYVPSSPQTARIEGTNSAPTSMLLFVLFWDGIVFTILFFVIRQYRRVKFLERNGSMISGEVVESSHSTDSDGDLSLKVEYSFQVPGSNRRLTKVERAQRNDLKGKRAPARGTPVVILYYDERRYMLL